MGQEGESERVQKAEKIWKVTKEYLNYHGSGNDYTINSPTIIVV